MDDRIAGNGWYVELLPELTQEAAEAWTLAAYKDALHEAVYFIRAELMSVMRSVNHGRR